jgi:hypothetical protein
LGIAYRLLRDINASKKHILVLSDGDANPSENYEYLAERIRRHDIGISTVTIKIRENPDLVDLNLTPDLMERISESGAGINLKALNLDSIQGVVTAAAKYIVDPFKKERVQGIKESVVECSLNGSSFFNVDSQQIKSIEESGGRCSTNDESIDVVIEPCAMNYYSNPVFRASAVNRSQYNFDAYSLQFVVYDHAGYGMKSTWAFNKSFRPGTKKTYEVELFGGFNCYEIGMIEISEHHFSIWGDEAFKLPDETVRRIVSISDIDWKDQNIKLKFFGEDYDPKESRLVKKRLNKQRIEELYRADTGVSAISKAIDGRKRLTSAVYNDQSSQDLSLLSPGDMNIIEFLKTALINRVEANLDGRKLPNLASEYRVLLSETGAIVGFGLNRSSGNSQFDKLVHDAIKVSAPFSVPEKETLYSNNFKNLIVKIYSGKN